MQMTGSDFTLNDWRRWLGGGDAIHYSKVELAAASDASIWLA